MSDKHLDALELDAVRAGEAPDADRAHAASCPECRAGVERLSAWATRLTTPTIAVPSSLRARLFRRPTWPRWAAAAALLIAAGAFWWPSNPDDLDRNGRVDIVDAYLLALRSEPQRAEQLAHKVVRLGGGP